MQFTIETTEEKLKKHLQRDYRNLSIFCLIMYTAIVLMLTFEFVFSNFWRLLLYYLFGLIVLALILYVLTKVTTKVSMYMLDKVVGYKYGKFTEIINEDGITEVIDNDVVKLKWSEVSKVVNAYKFIIVKPIIKKNPSFLFRKSYFKTEEEYNKVVNTINKYYQDYKNNLGVK